MSSNIDEKRKFPRLNLSCNIQYKLADEDTQIVSKTRDISSGGISFITYRPFPPGTIIDFTFSLTHNRVISARGRIIWTENFRIGDKPGWDNGIEFIAISKIDRSEISKYIQNIENQ